MIPVVGAEGHQHGHQHAHSLGVPDGLAWPGALVLMVVAGWHAVRSWRLAGNARRRGPAGAGSSSA